MILVDTSIWIDYLRGKKEVSTLSELLLENQVFSHPWVYGELMLGNLGAKRKEIIYDIRRLRSLPSFEIEELEFFLEKEKLYGKGLSLVDLQLLYACLAEDCQLWTKDRQLHQIANHFDKAYGVS